MYGVAHSHSEALKNHTIYCTMNQLFLSCVQHVVSKHAAPTPTLELITLGSPSAQLAPLSSPEDLAVRFCIPAFFLFS
jgi:hypothetical protein